MPKERIKQGDTIVLEDAGKTEVMNLNGEPTGIFARNIHLYEAGEELQPGDLLEEHPSFDIHWNKMVEGGDGWAHLSVTIPKAFLEHAVNQTDESDPYVRVYSDMLSRAELNRMVTLGRHVRDSAHGKDA